jgi:hypothetical protein
LLDQSRGHPPYAEKRATRRPSEVTGEAVDLLTAQANIPPVSIT